MLILTYLIAHFSAGVLGYVFILELYSKLRKGKILKGDIVRSLLAILLGPISIIVGLLFLFDLYCDKLDNRDV